ncbi:hypothetical protein AU193_16640 [Mycobacterium sp. GA-1285]|uniref:DUF4383 domain-containing protein n=1 Tax=Mycobacterium sp. GA-1285 TaxID=1772282 RepID=UPI000748A1F0|nr:DUF4383 domain-containing protein [Mycobacterium sp. GA-1285]KUI20181.1 hypothetical protein AU193_16640 [Mycobacterium sp. GA-1285]
MAKDPKYMAVQAAAVIAGVVLILLGALGFIPGLTQDYDRLAWADHRSGATLFGMISVSGLGNVANLVLGALGLVMARTYAAARAYFLGAGLVYFALFAYGYAVGNAFDWMWFGLGVVMSILGLTLAGQHDPTKRRRTIRA